MVVNLSAECNFVALGGASRVESSRDEGGKAILYLSHLFCKVERISENYVRFNASR